MTNQQIIQEFEERFPQFEGIGTQFPIFKNNPNYLYIESFLLFAFEQKEKALENYKRELRGKIKKLRKNPTNLFAPMKKKYNQALDDILTLIK